LGGGTKNQLHSFEFLSPEGNLSLNFFPFLRLDVSQLVTFDDNYFVELVDLGINNSVRDRFNCPLFNVISRNLTPETTRS